jgi:trehalose 6-phosphate phosphatase
MAAAQLTLPPPIARRDALFLDIDGTLLDLAPTPAEVRIDAEVSGLLPELHSALAGACALVTGRALSDLDGLFPGLALPAAGQHGCERRDAQGTLHLHAPDRGTLSRLRALFADFATMHEGLMLEDKGATLALHYRLAPQLAAQVRRTVASALAHEPGAALCLQPGKMLIEIRPEKRDKGTAIRDFMSEFPFAGRRPVFVGDDHGDEHGFAVVQRFQGYGVKVGPGRTRARHHLPDVAAVRHWLADFVAGQSDPRRDDR